MPITTEVGFNSTALMSLIARVASSRQVLEANLSAANRLIERDIEMALSTLFKPSSLATAWDVGSYYGFNPELAGVYVRTADKRVLWYVYGTKPHPIYPVRAKALHFWWRRFDLEVFFSRVNHPGTEAHEHAKESLKVAIGTSARTHWVEAIMATFETIKAGTIV